MQRLLVDSKAVNVGMRFGKLTVAGRPFATYGPVTSGKLKIHNVVCRCDCGKSCVTIVSTLTRTRRPTRSCGCKTVDSASTRGGGSRTEPRLYQIWNGIIQRCYNEKRQAFKDYGGRGILMCDEWRSDFQSFVEWSRRNGYSDELEIDRRNNDLGYSPENCRWVTPKVNTQNTRANIRITAFGETKVATEWARDPRCRVAGYASILYRIRAGFTPEDAITIPPKTGSRAKTYR